MKSMGIMHHWEHGPSRHALQYARSLIALSEERIESVLDVGAADGIVSQVFSGPNQAAYQGIDVGAPIYERSSVVRYLDNPVLLMGALRKESAEAVLAYDILEHVDKFESFARLIFASSRRLVMISLPNEMSIHVRLGFVRGKCVPCHGLSMLRSAEGHRHRWLINYRDARSALCEIARDNGFEMLGQVFLTTLPKTCWKRWLLKPALSVLPVSLRSHGFAFVFEKRS